MLLSGFLVKLNKIQAVRHYGDYEYIISSQELKHELFFTFNHLVIRINNQKVSVIPIFKFYAVALLDLSVLSQ